MSSIDLFPATAKTDDRGHLTIADCDVVALATEYGTPLYIFDEHSLRHKCAEFKHEFGQRYPDVTIAYASKAFLNLALVRIINDQGLGLDVVSGGELGIAHAAGFPMERVFFHGNNKSTDELQITLRWGVGRIVVDNFHELNLLTELAARQGVTCDILLRLSPGVDPHTHQYTTTGVVDSKFGFPMEAANKAVAAALAADYLNLTGLHCHLGSPIFETAPHQQAIDVLLELATAMKAKHGWEIKELNIGGGFAVQYTRSQPAPPLASYAEAITSRVTEGCRALALAPPHLIIEPGRAIVGPAGVALYRVGTIKDIPGIRRYVAVDGGLGDNIRPALYQAQYEAVVANKMLAEATEKVTIAGKFCESGDIIIRDIILPPVAAGDIIAVAGCGAYCLPLASNYNGAPRPAVIMVNEGQARLIRRRETLNDLIRCDIF